MLKKFRSKRGVVEVMFAAIVLCMTIGAVLLTPSHRVRKANQICLSTGMSEGLCAKKVAGMDKKQILEYIRDI